MARRTRSISIFAAILAALLALWAPAALAHHKDGHTKGGTQSTESDASDHDGDADSDPNTAYEDSHETTNDEPNAHPSGNDKDGESGGSGNQGKAESNPDDSKGPMRYEGVQGDDKPAGPGGTDLDDQDGNNGCGNDDDFNDDNNGWCGRPTKPTTVKPTDVNKPVCDADAAMPGNQKCEEIKGEVIVDFPAKPCDADATMPGTQKCEKPDDEVDAEVIVAPELEETPATPVLNEVLGVRINAAVQPAAVAPAAVAPAAVAAAPAAQGAVLPFTGTSDLLPLVAVGLMLIAAGALSLRGRFSSK